MTTTTDGFDYGEPRTTNKRSGKLELGPTATSRHGSVVSIAGSKGNQETIDAKKKGKKRGVVTN